MDQEGNTSIALNKDQSISREFVKRYGNHKKSTTVGFERANWQLALKNKIDRSNRYYKGEQVPYTVSLEHFKMYGPGVYLFFTFLKHVSFLFLIMSIISLMPTIYNYIVGTQFSNVSSSLQVYLGMLSVGNHVGALSTLSINEQVTQSNKNKLFNAIPDMVNCCLFFFFYFYWLKKSSKITEQIKSQIKLPNYFTVELQDFPEGTTEAEAKEYLGRFGTVNEVAPVRNYDEMIQLSKKIYEASLELKQLRLTSEDTQKLEEKQQKEKKIQSLYEELANAEQKKDDRTIKFYVNFTTPNIREDVLKQFKPYLERFRCCKEPPQDKFLLNGKLCKVVACNEQPSGILWENAHITWKTRWIRAIIQFLILFILIFIGFLLISLLNILVPASSNTSIDTSNYTTTTILSQTNALIVQSWCIKNTADALSTTALKALCQTYITRYYLKIAISVGISIAVVVIKMIMKIIVVFLARFQRYKTQAQQSKDMIMNLFITYTCTSVLIIFLLQANVFKISFKQIINGFINNQYLKENLLSLKEYNDFAANWYLDIGYQIWLTWLIIAVSPHSYMPILQWIKQKINLYNGQKEVLQKNMEKRIQSQQFQFEDNYANVLMIIFVCISFCGGIPFLIPITFIALSAKYIYFKYSFIRFCRVPKTFDDSINSKITSILPIALFIHFAFTIWMYGVKDLFMYQDSWASSYVKSDTVKHLMVVIERFVNTWYMTALWVVLMVIYALKTLLYDLLMKMFTSQNQKVPQNVLTGNGEGAIIRSQRSLTASYKLENNPDYFEILAIMKTKK